jgi:hypothetical protein
MQAYQDAAKAMPPMVRQAHHEVNPLEKRGLILSLPKPHPERVEGWSQEFLLFQQTANA